MARAVGGWVTSAAFIWMASAAHAQSAPDPHITVLRGDGQITMTVAVDALRIEQVLTPRSVAATFSEGADVVRIAATLGGLVRVERAGQTVTLAMRDFSAAQAQRVRALLSESRAVARFEQLANSDWASRTRSAAALSATHAVVALVQGNMQPLGRVAREGARLATPRLQTVSQGSSSSCWTTYSRDVIQYTYELETCIRDASYSLNPFAAAWCGYEYNVKTILAFYWLLDCNGVG
ncbi:MAG: hypothetical protein ACT4QD_15670 [Acidobacteriota bacterium]